MPSQLQPRVRATTPIVTDLESLKNAVAAEVLSQLASIGITVQANIPAINVPKPEITVQMGGPIVSPADVSFDPQIVVNPARVDLALDVAPLADLLTRVIAGQDQLAASNEQIVQLLSRPVIRTVDRDVNGAIIRIIDTRG